MNRDPLAVDTGIDNAGASRGQSMDSGGKSAAGGVPTTGGAVGDQSTSARTSLLPSVTTPKGGGAIRGIGEKFSVNAATGTATLSVPVATSKSRGNFGPDLSLTYDSGAGNGPFAIGFRLSVPAITRKTDKGLPRYWEESDVYILSGAEELVPELDQATGSQVQVLYEHYRAYRYRPRVEGAFVRIERWVHRMTHAVHWRVTTKENVTHIYGRREAAQSRDRNVAASRIADPTDPERVFSWLLEESQDDKGNVIRYEYKAEDGAGVDPTRASEVTRFGRKGDQAIFTATSQRYLKRILYGNRTPYEASERADGYLFEVVFDYGEHDAARPTPDEEQRWIVRKDAFSSYRAAFEVRTYRLCQRILMFHRFGSAGNAAQLVASSDFRYESNDVITYLRGVTHRGHVINETGELESQNLPELQLDYQRPVLNDQLTALPHESLPALAGGVDGNRRQWVDLDGEGIPGVLIDANRGWYYKSNLGKGRLSPPQLLRAVPSPGNLAGGTQKLEDLAGDGQLDLVQYGPPVPGFFERTPEGSFEPLRTFKSLPDIDWNDPNLRFVDIDGDGLVDLLITEDSVLIWYHSLGKDGYELGGRVARALEEERGPAVVFADNTECIQLVDMTGDGLLDIARVRNGEVCYWPSLGYGRFGGKVTLDNSPWFAKRDEFDPRRVRFADVDGSGTSDVFYLGSEQVTLYLNQAGNSLSEKHTIHSLPPVDNLTQLNIVDLLGQGTSCLVWSSPLPAAEAQPVFYVDLMAGIKPHLLHSVVNNLGAETTLTYAASTKYYLEDKVAGAPWLTRLAFPVQVVARIVHNDSVSNSRLVSQYAYHHGFFDGVEREFRGFARVDQTDAEAFSIGDPDTDLHQPPVHTITWFHTGAWLEKERLEHALKREYYQHGPAAFLLPDTVLPPDMTVLDEREAARALRGTLLRREIYSEDGTEQASAPYVITESNFKVVRIQSANLKRHGIFFAHPLETITTHTERNPADPRISHDFTLKVNAYGDVESKAAIVYARQHAPANLPEQARVYAILTETDFALHDVTPPPGVQATETNDWYRASVQFDQRTYELTGVAPVGAVWKIDELREKVASLHESPFESPAPANVPARRLVERKQQLFYRNDLSGPLPLGHIESLALPYQSAQLALTLGLVEQLVSTSGALSGEPFDQNLLVTEGKYERRSGYYWASSGRVIFDRTRFYLPVEVIDPFGNHSFVQYDDFALLLEETRDPLGNRTQVQNDYRVLAPKQITDPNLNRTAFAFDALGIVTATAVMGKAGAGEGDTLEDPTVRFEYDLLRWQREGRPAFVHTFAREQHGPSNPRFQETFTYSDGFGRVVMQKVQAEPGDAPLRDARGVLERNPDGTFVIGHVDARWVGTGRTVYNNKGNPVKQYEPFFSSTSEYEDEEDLVQWGVTPIMHYDGLDRVIRTDLPNGTLSRVVFDAWRQENWDPNDTVLESDWYQRRITGAMGPEEHRAALLTTKHAKTPPITHLDPLGRAVLLQADNGPDPDQPDGKHRFFDTRTELDIEGNQLSITDARGIRTIEQRFDVLGRRFTVKSPDAGTRLSAADVAGKQLRSWDSRGQTSRSRYDALQRPTHTFVKAGTSEKVVARTVYGELLDTVDVEAPDPTQPSPAQALNLRGQAYLLFDGAGLQKNDQFDFKSNLLSATRHLASTYKTTADWAQLPDRNPAEIEAHALAYLLEQNTPEQPTRFTTTMTYDALNRVTSQTTPDGSVTLPKYNEANLLEAVHVQARGAAALTTIVKNIDYNAKGQRIRCEHGELANVAHSPSYTVTYEYDSKTFRLIRLETHRASPSATLQKLLYTYDPVGNIVQVLDRADWEPLFATRPSENNDGLYVYDPLYRLTHAQGREHPGQQVTADDAQLFEKIPHPNDVQVLARYREEYTYDEVGNILSVHHGLLVPNPTIPDWTRHYQYAADSNRLLSTSQPIGTTPNTVPYTYDPHGSMTSMPHLAAMVWDYADRLEHVNKGGGGDVYFTYDASGQRVRKVYVHGGIVEERIYLGGYEIYRKHYDSMQNASDEERQTLHVMDDKRRVAMLEAKTRDAAAPIASPTTRYRFQLDNHLGSAILEVDESGKVISYEEYHPYGSTAFHTADDRAEVSAKRYRYTGKERDEETSLYYHGARYYAAWLGRWTASDPATLQRPSASNLNAYCYVNGHVVKSVDSGGLEEVEPQYDVGPVLQAQYQAIRPELERRYPGLSDPTIGAKKVFTGNPYKEMGGQTQLEAFRDPLGGTVVRRTWTTPRAPGQKKVEYQRYPASSPGEPRPPVELTSSSSNVTKLRGSEGFKKVLYLDTAGKPTIGIGTRVWPKDMPKYVGREISLEEAITLYINGLRNAERIVKSYIHAQLTQYQFDALVSYAYNTNVGGIAAIYELVNAGKFREAALAMIGRVSTEKQLVDLGVLERRMREVGLFLTGNVAPRMSPKKVEPLASELRSALKSGDPRRISEVEQRIVDIAVKRANTEALK